MSDTSKQAIQKKAAINLFGFLSPILINEDGIISRYRLLVAERLGLREVQVVRLNRSHQDQSAEGASDA